MKEYKHKIEITYLRSDGAMTCITRVTDEDRNLEHLADDAFATFKEIVIDA